MSLEPRDFAFDVLVIGGGIVGSGVARDACLRGLSCLLVEKGDFSSGTSSRTSHVVHSGISYLERGGFHLVLGTMHERDLLLRMAPHLLRPLPIAMPLYDGDARKPWKLRVAMGVYDRLRQGKAPGGHDLVLPAAALGLFPSLAAEGLRGTAVFQDHQLAFPERLVLENVFSAREHGGFCLNYHEVVRIEDGLDHFRVAVHDVLDGSTHEATARVVVNATGAWSDRVSSLYRPGLAPKATGVKGTQLVVRGALPHAVCVPAARDGRLFFALPYEGHTLLGLARSPHADDPDDVSPTQPEAQALADELGRLLPDHRVAHADFLWATAALHPLAVHLPPGNPAAPSLRHVLHREGNGGRFLTVVGGTFTMFRRMAEEAVDACCRLLGHPVPSSTDRVPFCGGGFKDSVLYRENLCEWAQSVPELPRDVLDHLIALYGRRCCDVLRVAAQRAGWREPVAPGYRDLKAQVIHAVREEDAHHVSDVVLRRLRLGASADRGLAGAPAVADLMAGELGWDEATRERELADFAQRVNRERPFAQGAAR